MKLPWEISAHLFGNFCVTRQKNEQPSRDEEAKERGGRGGDKNNEKYNGERRPQNKKPSFKPKYEEVKKTEKNDDDSSLEASD